MAQSSDPDADAVLAGFDHPEAAHDSDAAAVLASFDKPAAPKSGSEVVKDLIHSKVSHGAASVAGGLREIGQLATGTSMADADVNYQKYVKDNTYQPTDPTSQALIGVNQQAESSPYNPMTLPGRAFDAAGKGINAVTGTETAGPVAVGIAQGVLPFMGMRSGSPGPASLSSAQAALDTAAANSKQSMGAAAAAPRITSLSPDIQQAVRSAVQQTGGAINPEVLARHAEADSLPVPMRLTEGQATQDPMTISQEMNTRGRTPQMVERLNQQNAQLKDNVTSIRDRIGPDVHTTNDVEHGDTLMQAYRDHDEARQADIADRYKTLIDANGGTFPVDVKALLTDAEDKLHHGLLFEHAPRELGQLQNLAESGKMTFEQFEAMRTNLARTQRSSPNGNERVAAGVIRQSMEDLPLQPAAAGLKPLADSARQAARSRFEAIERDPAYKAVVNDSTPPDQFVRKFVTGPAATRDGVELMRDTIGGDDTIRQTMGVAALDHLRKSSGVDPMGNGNFTQAGFNKALVALDPKMRSLVDPQTAEQLSTLGNVARYTQNQPRGSFVNNSNTFVSALGHHAAGLAEGAANTFLGGRVIPVGTMVREGVQRRAAAKATEKSLAPGAGLARLSDVGKP